VTAQTATLPRADRQFHVLTLTPFYPHTKNDAEGCFVAEPLKWTASLGIQNEVISTQPFYRGAPEPADDVSPATGKSYFSFPGGFGLSSAGFFLFSTLLRQVRKLHQERPIQLIHAHGPLPCGHAAALLGKELGIPFVVTVHGLDAYATEQVKGVAGRRCHQISLFVYRSACRVICISERVQHAIVQGGGRLQTEVVYNGVDQELFHPTQNTINEFVSVGNLIPIKGHESLMRAFAAVHMRFPNLHWRIIGDGPERVRLSALAAELGLREKVLFAGWQNRTQVAAAVGQALLFALPSRYEGLGCVYLEAMSAAKPVVGCYGQGIAEVIRHGVNGWLVEPDNVEALTHALATLLADEALRQRISAEARRTVLHGFTLAHQAERLNRVYRECVP
jgi:glycosyltransferase involved in cell wall biosynthesis